ncbi:MAG: O-antigen ligase family protein [Anaerolineaceae bacterium]
MREQKQSIRWGYLLTETLLIILCSYLLLVASTKTNQLNPTIVLINSILLSMAAVFLIFKSRVDSGLEIPLGIMMGVMLLTSFTSLDPRRSIAEFGLIATPITLFFIVNETVHRNLPKELIIKSLLAVGGIFMIFSWQQTIGWYISWIKANPGMLIPNSNFRLNDPNLLAMLFNVWLMLALARMMVSNKSAERWILGVYSLSCLGIIYFTSSRGGWLGTAAGLLCLGLVYFRIKKDQWLPVWEKFKKNRVLIGGSVVILMVVGIIGGYLLFRQLSHPSHGSRTEIWTPAIQAFLASPILGKGPFTFISAFLQANSVPPMIPYDYAHSIYLDLLSGTGILGLAAFIILMAAVMKMFLSRVRDTTGQEWAVAVGGLAALATFLIHGLVDSTHHSEPISLWNICIVAGTALTLPGEIRRPTNWKKLIPVSLALAAAGLTWYCWWTLLPMKSGVDKAAAGDWSEAEVLFESAIQRDGKMAAAYQQAGMANSMLAVQGGEEPLDKAISYFEKTAELDPYWELNQANLAALYHSAGRLEEAQVGYEQALKFSPHSEIFQLNLGVVQEELGDLAGAEKAYQTVFSLQPDWMEASFWRANSFRQEMMEEWQISHPGEPVLDLTAMKTLVNTWPDSLSAYLPLIRAYLDQENLLEAEKTISRAEFAAGSTSLHLELEWLKVELEAAKQDYEKSIAHGQQIIEAATDYGIFGPATPGNKIYNLYMFRRPAVEIDLVPQMEVIRWPDKWGHRALKLADWVELTGDKVEADRWREVVLNNIPDVPAP